MSSIVLGYWGTKVVPTKHAVDFRSSRFGGQPLFASPGAGAGMDRALVQCKCCTKPMVFVLQAYAPLPERLPDTVERILYLFACPGPECGGKPGSWAVVREQIEMSPPAAEPAAADDDQPSSSAATPSAFSFDFSDVTGGGSGAGGGKKKKNKKKKQQQQQDTARSDQTEEPSQQPPTLKTKESLSLPSTIDPAADVPFGQLSKASFWLEVDYEPLAINADLSHERELLKRYQREGEGAVVGTGGGGGDGGGGAGGEEWEQETHFAVFAKFARRLSRSPEQMLRYRFNGEPLWPVSTCDPGCKSQVPSQCRQCSIQVPPCSLCGAERCFEMQLVSTLVPNLQEQLTPPSLAAFDFGLVTVFSCKQSCTPKDGGVLVPEFCLVLPAL